MRDIDLYFFSCDKEEKFLVHPEDKKVAKERFLSPDLQQKFLLQRHLLRNTLSHYMGKSALKKSISFEENGKPFFPHSPWNFSLAHCDSLLLISIAHTISLGIDVERKKENLSWKGMMEVIASPQEVKAMNMYSSVEQEDLFYLLWVKKEAYSKRHGFGFTKDPKRWSLGFSKTDSLNGIYSFELFPGIFAAVSYSSIGTPRIKKCNF